MVNFEIGTAKNPSFRESLMYGDIGPLNPFELFFEKNVVLTYKSGKKVNEAHYKWMKDSIRFTQNNYTWYDYILSYNEQTLVIRTQDGLICTYERTHK